MDDVRVDIVYRTKRLEIREHGGDEGTAELFNLYLYPHAEPWGERKEGQVIQDFTRNDLEVLRATIDYTLKGADDLKEGVVK